MSPVQRHTGALGTVASAILQRDSPRLYARRLTCGFAMASFLAVAMGCIVARAADVGFGVWARNPAAWATLVNFAWNGSPEGFPRGAGVTFRVEIPCPAAASTGIENNRPKLLRVHTTLRYPAVCFAHP